ncbi:hypothetical protein [Rhizobium sp. BK379]|uniref:hypothetical protein n=1 Tax=Rhizobium sp. BK379 TaxID=2587059 RepID=UPI001607DDBE|nr:hypothetical protein [Rhizobium sp. BK379]MBB3440950.1 hypothetical protein [Rhizobium sp. BK379]
MIVTIDATTGEFGAANAAEMEYLFSEVLRASILGKHFVLLDRVTCDWAMGNLTLGAQYQAHLQLLKQEFTQRGAIRAVAGQILSIKIGGNGLQPVTSQKYEIGHRTLLQGNYLDVAVLLVANTANDGEFLKQILNMTKRNHPIGHFAFVVRHGGGSTIVECFNEELNAQRITICIVDSDRLSPHNFSSTTVRALQASANQNAYVGGIFPTPCREIENFIPLDLIERHRLCPTYPDFQKLKAILQRQDIQDDAHNACWLYFDLKMGLSGPALLAKGLQADIEAWIQQHFTPDSETFNQTNIAGFGTNILRTFLNSNPAMRDYNDFTKTSFWAAVFAPLFEKIAWFLAADKRKAAV